MKAETLKKAILQYAMQGKLVEQDPNDEPASVLLERIKAEKEQLIKDGKIKKEKPLPPIAEDEIPFQIPSSWEWCRVNDIGVYKKGPFGSALTKKIFVPKGTDTVKVYEQKNAIQKDYTLGEYYISREYYEESMKSFTVSPGDVIVSCAGTIGETYVMPENIELGIINQALMRMTITKEIDLKYFLMYFDIILKRDSKTYSKGSAIKNIPPFEIFKPMLVPLPPLAEQERIVEKLEQILPLVEEYGKNEEKLSKLNSTLPDKIKQSILQHAVQGKLVPQNSDDEPASELLKRIKAEKEQLIKDGKIKKEKPLPPIIEDEIPYELPQGWEWVRLVDIGYTQTGTTPSTSHPEYFNGEYPFIKPASILNNGKINYVGETLTEIGLNNGRIITPNTVLMVCIGGSIGKVGIIDRLCSFNQQINSVTCYVEKMAKYIFYCLFSPYFYNTVLNIAPQTTLPIISKGKWEQILVPLPPLAEQQRIVTKVEELLAVVDKLN